MIRGQLNQPKVDGVTQTSMHAPGRCAPCTVHGTAYRPLRTTHTRVAPQPPAHAPATYTAHSRLTAQSGPGSHTGRLHTQPHSCSLCMLQGERCYGHTVTHTGRRRRHTGGNTGSGRGQVEDASEDAAHAGSRAGGGACEGVGGGGRAYCGAAKREGDEGQEEGRRASRVGGGGR